jgi:mannosyltransferase
MDTPSFARNSAATTLIQRLSSVLADVKGKPLFQYALLAAITLLAMLLRFYKLGEWSFWTDELFTVNRVEAHYASLDQVARTIVGTKWIPLSLLLISPVLKMLGVNEWTARFVPALIGGASVPFLYLPTRRIFGPTVALIAALLLAISPWHIYWSQNARFYTSLMLFSSLALFAFYFGLERARPAYLMLSMVLLYVALSERLLAFFALPVAGAYVLWLWLSRSEKPPGLRRRYVLWLTLAAVICLLLLSKYALDVVTQFGGTANHTVLRLVASIGQQLGVSTVALSLASGTYMVLQRNRAGLFVLLSAVVPVALLVAVSPFAFTVDRYIFAALPFWLILSALAIKELIARSSRLPALLAVGILVVLFGAPLSEDALYFAFQHGNRPDWRSAYQVIAQRKLDSDIVATAWPNVGRYYLDAGIVWINGVKPEATVNHRIWFVIDEAIGGVEPELQQWIRRESDLVEVIPNRAPGRSLDIRIYLYTPASVLGRQNGNH